MLKKLIAVAVFALLFGSPALGQSTPKKTSRCDCLVTGICNCGEGCQCATFVQAKGDELSLLKAENAALKAELSALKAKTPAPATVTLGPAQCVGGACQPQRSFAASGSCSSGSCASGSCGTGRQGIFARFRLRR